MSRVRKKRRAVLCAVLLCFVLTACGTESILSSIDMTSGMWIDSDLIGSVKEDSQFRVQDDFAAAVNGPWKLEQGDRYYGTFQSVKDAVMARKKQIVTDPSISGETADCLKAYYQLASDWDRRNAAGIEPLRTYIEDIASIDSVEDLYSFFADPVRNPLYLSPVTTDLGYVMMHLEKAGDSYAVYFTSPELSLTYNGSNESYFKLNSEESFDRFERVKKKASYMLDRLGYSEGEASKLIKQCMAWEKKVAEADDRAAAGNPEEILYSREEADALTGDFPFAEIIRAWGFTDTRYIMINPGYAGKLKRLCGKGKLDQVRAFLIVNYCLRASLWLDRPAYDKMAELDRSGLSAEKEYGRTDEQKEDELLFNSYIGDSPMAGAMNRVYVEHFFDDAQVAELNEITQDLIRGFEEIFSGEEWLSGEGKAACIEKLKAMGIHIAHQDFDSVDYGNLQFKTSDEGGSFLEACFAARRFEMDHTAWLADQTYDPSYWDPLNRDFSTTQTNAVYMPSTNGIYIFAGICEPPVYSPDMTYEEKLAGLFTVVGHEITHGFDKTGAQYDKEGANNAWLPEEDQAAFTDRNDKVGTFYTTLRPYSGSGLYIGTNVNGEATADMGGLKAALHLARKVPDFDYDRFFRAYAKMWKLNVPLEEEKDKFRGDPHPLAFYRINVGLQQFDEFYETYGIKEEDGMYLKPEDRIKVW